jgi:hypothetical protein
MSLPKNGASVKLEDNWRRKNKQSISLETEEEDNLDAPTLLPTTTQLQNWMIKNVRKHI